MATSAQRRAASMAAGTLNDEVVTNLRTGERFYFSGGYCVRVVRLAGWKVLFLRARAWIVDALNLPTVVLTRDAS